MLSFKTSLSHLIPLPYPNQSTAPAASSIASDETQGAEDLDQALDDTHTPSGND